MLSGLHTYLFFQSHDYGGLANDENCISLRSDIAIHNRSFYWHSHIMFATLMYFLALLTYYFGRLCTVDIYKIILSLSLSSSELNFYWSLFYGVSRNYILLLFCCLCRITIIIIPIYLSSLNDNIDKHSFLP